MVITSTPLRISFFGGGTDYPVWYREMAVRYSRPPSISAVILLADDYRPFSNIIAASPIQRSKRLSRNDSIQHPSVRACLQFLGIDEGVEIHHVADLPARTGLGTSSAFTVGFLHALYALNNQMCDKRTLASEAIHVEQDLLGEAVGAQDQVSAAYGALTGSFSTHGSIDVKRMLVSQAGRELEEHLGSLFHRVFPTASEIAHEQLRMTPQEARAKHHASVCRMRPRQYSRKSESAFAANLAAFCMRAGKSRER